MYLMIALTECSIVKVSLKSSISDLKLCSECLDLKVVGHETVLQREEKINSSENPRVYNGV